MVKSRLMKRTASFAVSAALLFSCIPAGAYAAEAGTADTNEINVKGIGTVYYEASADGNVTVNGAEQKATASGYAVWIGLYDLGSVLGRRRCCGNRQYNG